MKTTDLFKSNRSAKKINESLQRTFGSKLNLESFDLPKLEDARNKIRTQLSQVRSESGFNENLENEAYTQAQWMLDALNSEIAERQEFVADPGVAAVDEGFSTEVEEFFHKVANSDDGYDMLYNAHTGKYGKDVEKAVGDMYDDITIDTGYHGDDDFEEIYSRMMDNIEADYKESDADAPGYGDHEGGETDDNYAMASAGFGSDEDYESVNNEAYVNNAKDAVNLLADIRKQSKMAELGQGEPVRPNQLVNDLWDVMQWIENNMKESFDPLKHVENPTQGEKDAAKDVKRGSYGDRAALLKSAENDGRLKKDKTESINTGEDMRNLREGEIQQASAIVTAKTMVDRVGRWIEELSGMENDTLLQLGDSIRDEMGQEQAKTFISAVAPAIQQALANLKTTRETLASGMRTLTGEEQAAGMLGDEPTGDEFGDIAEPAAPDEMNAAPENDAFAAAEPAVGGIEGAGREQRESIERGNNLLRVLAG